MVGLGALVQANHCRSAGNLPNLLGRHQADGAKTSWQSGNWPFGGWLAKPGHFLATLLFCPMPHCFG
jgi:hypothetical protein